MCVCVAVFGLPTDVETNHISRDEQNSKSAESIHLEKVVDNPKKEDTNKSSESVENSTKSNETQEILPSIDQDQPKEVTTESNAKEESTTNELASSTAKPDRLMSCYELPFSGVYINPPNSRLVYLADLTKSDNEIRTNPPAAPKTYKRKILKNVPSIFVNLFDV